MWAAYKQVIALWAASEDIRLPLPIGQSPISRVGVDAAPILASLCNITVVLAKQLVSNQAQ